PDVVHTIGCEPPSTSTTTPSTSTTTPSTSTTTRPPACSAGACDDGKPCTIDRCAEDGCHHDAVVGFAAACSACRGGLGSPGCAGVAAPPSIGRKIDHACALTTEALTTSKPKRKHQLQHRAAASLTGAAGAARKAAHKRRLPPACAAAPARPLKNASSSVDLGL